MNYLLDTNVLWETMRKNPDTQVQLWFQSVPSEKLFVSVLTLGEIRRGVEKLGDQPRKEIIASWLENAITFWFDERILLLAPEN